MRSYKRWLKIIPIGGWLIGISGTTWAGTVAHRTFYELNPQIVKASDPIWEALKRDSAAGAIGRFAVTMGSSIQWLRRGYHRQVGLFDIHVGEADMPGSGEPGFRSSIGCNLVGDHLKFDLRNDSPLDGSADRVQSANLVFQVRM